MHKSRGHMFRNALRPEKAAISSNLWTSELLVKDEYLKVHRKFITDISGKVIISKTYLEASKPSFFLLFSGTSFKLGSDLLSSDIGNGKKLGLNLSSPEVPILSNLKKYQISFQKNNAGLKNQS